jgi:hypothetical protein
MKLETSKTHILNTFLFHNFYTSTSTEFQHLFAFSYSPGFITDVEVFTFCSSIILRFNHSLLRGDCEQVIAWDCN